MKITREPVTKDDGNLAPCAMCGGLMVWNSRRKSREWDWCDECRGAVVESMDGESVADKTFRNMVFTSVKKALIEKKYLTSDVATSKPRRGRGRSTRR